MSDNTIDVGFTVDIKALVSGLAQAQEQVKDIASAINGALGGISKSAESADNKLANLKAADNIKEQTASEIQNVQILKSLHQISADDAIAQLKRIEDARHASELSELNSEEAAAAGDLATQERTNTKIEGERVKHDARMRALDLQAVQQSEKSWQAIVNPISHAFQSSLQGVITGTQSVSQAMAKLGQSMITQFADMAVKRATDWVVSELTMTEATEAGNTARAASDQAASAVSTGFSIGKALARIEGAAAETYANVFAWASPELGPFAAVPAAAASALVIAKEALIPSAAGGWDIPSGLNPVTQLHANEMVLPAQYANVIRGLAGSDGASGGATMVNINVSAVDAAGVQRLFMQNGSALMRAIQAQIRNGASPVPT